MSTAITSASPRPMNLLHGSDAPKTFHTALETGKASLPPDKARGVNSRSEAELAQFSHLFLSEDRKVMVGAHNGEMKALLNTGKKGEGGAAILQALHESPIVRAFVFTPEKAKYFERFGLRPVARYPWAGQARPPVWPEGSPKPDTYALAYDPKGKLANIPVKDVTNYREALAVVHDKLSGHAHRPGAERIDPKTGAPKQRMFVVGAGIVGMFIAKALAERGHEVTMFEKSDTIPNPDGASGDRNRIFREAYSQPGMIRMAQRSLVLWHHLSKQLGGDYYKQRGTLILSYAKGDRVDAFKDGLDRGGQSYKLLTPDDVVRDHPYLSSEALRYAIHQPDDGGLLYPQAIGKDLLQHLKTIGVEVRTGVNIIEHHARDEAGGVILTAKDRQRFVGDQVVFARGPWSGEYTPKIAEDMQVKPAQTSVVYLKPPAEFRDAWEKAPCMMIGGNPHSSGPDAGPTPGYILPPTPDRNGIKGPGLKLGAAFVKRPSDDLDRDHRTVGGDGKRLLGNFARVLAKPEAYEIEEVKTCPISFAAHEAFGSRTLKELSDGKPGLGADGLVVIADSGHAYKHGPIIGDYVATAMESGDHARLQRQLAGDE